MLHSIDGGRENPDAAARRTGSQVVLDRTRTETDQGVSQRAARVLQDLQGRRTEGDTGGSRPRTAVPGTRLPPWPPPPPVPIDYYFPIHYPEVGLLIPEYAAILVLDTSCETSYLGKLFLLHRVGVMHCSCHPPLCFKPKGIYTVFAPCCVEVLDPRGQAQAVVCKEGNSRGGWCVCRISIDVHGGEPIARVALATTPHELRAYINLQSWLGGKKQRVSTRTRSRDIVAESVQ